MHFFIIILLQAYLVQADSVVPIAGPAQVKIVGRNTFDNRFSWPGSAVTVHFSGSGPVSIVLEESNDEALFSWDLGCTERVGCNSDFHCEKQRGEFTLPPGTSKILLTHVQTDGEHFITVRRETEGVDRISKFLRFEFDRNIKLLAPAPLAAKRIEIIGDSVSAGYGVLGDKPTCGFSPETERVSQAFGNMAARKLSCRNGLYDLTTIATSGIGVFRNASGEGTSMPHDYDFTLAQSDISESYDFRQDISRSSPEDIVILDIGINDFQNHNPPLDNQHPDLIKSFKKSYTDFFHHVRATHPQAQIYMTVGTARSNGNHNPLVQITQALYYQLRIEDKKLFFIDVTLSDIWSGCNAHPNVDEQSLMADKLVKNILGIKKKLVRQQ